MQKTTVLWISVALLVAGLLQPASVVAADSEAAYKAKCASCHGPDGKGKQKIAEMLKIDLSRLELVDDETSKKSDAELARITRDGEGKSMKPFKSQFSDAEITELVKYIRSLKK